MTHDDLRKARETRALSLDELANRTGVRLAVLTAIDLGAYGELPAGLYARHAIRAYANAVGVDANRVLDEVAELLPTPEDPLDGLARLRGLARRRHVDHAVPGTSCEAPHDAEKTSSHWRVAIASAIDGAVLAAPVLLLAKATAVTAGTDVANVIAVALPAWALIAALVASMYFVLLGGLRNATFGTSIAGVRLEQRPAPQGDAMSAVHRGLQCALRESSIVVEWLIVNCHRSRYTLKCPD